MSTLVQQPPHRSGFVGPLILIGIGIVFLMNTLGMVTWDIWGALLRLWPILLIGAGLDLLIGERSMLARLLVGVLTLLLFAAGMWYFSSVLSVTGWSEQTFSQNIGGAERADVTLNGGVGTFRVNAGSTSDTLVLATLDLAPNENATESFAVNNGTAVYRLTSESNGPVSTFPFWQPNNQKVWAIELNRTVPTDLTISTGVGEAILNLESLTLTALNVNTGVGQTILTLPQRGDYRATVHAGVGNVTIHLPPGLAASITVSTGLGDVNVDGDFDRDGERYTSPDWRTATDRVSLQLDAGVGTVTIVTDP